MVNKLFKYLFLLIGFVSVISSLELNEEELIQNHEKETHEYVISHTNDLDLSFIDKVVGDNFINPDILYRILFENTFLCVNNYHSDFLYIFKGHPPKIYLRISSLLI